MLFSAADFADIANATATEVAAAINAVIVGGRATTPGGIVRLASDTEGTASRVQVTGGTANAVLAFPGAASVGGGNVANLRAVEVAEVKAVVEAAIPTVTVDAGVGGVLDIRTVATGPGASVQAAAATAAAFGLDNALHSGRGLGHRQPVRASRARTLAPTRTAWRPRCATPRTARRARSTCSSWRTGVPRVLPEPLDEPERRRYVESIVNDARNGSVYVRVIDQLLVGAPLPPPQTVALAGGSDGLVGLDDNDFIGSEPAKTGLTRSTRCRSCRCSSCPGAPRPPSTTRWCVTARSTATARGLRRARPARETRARRTSSPRRDDRRARAALRVRRHLLAPREGAQPGQERVRLGRAARRPALGHRGRRLHAHRLGAAGRRLRSARRHRGGPHVRRARLRDRRGTRGEQARPRLPAPHQPAHHGPGLPRYIDGSRTLKGNGNFPYVAERRGVIFIERSLKQGLQFARHKNNTEGTARAGAAHHHGRSCSRR